MKKETWDEQNPNYNPDEVSKVELTRMDLAVIRHAMTMRQEHLPESIKQRKAFYKAYHTIGAAYVAVQDKQASQPHKEGNDI